MIWWRAPEYVLDPTGVVIGEDHRKYLTRWTTAGKFPILQPLGDVEEGINAARATIPHCTFDAAACTKGIKALKG